MRKLFATALSSGALVALTAGALTVGPVAHADTAPTPTYTSDATLDSHVILQDFSFYQPYESNTYTTLTKQASALKDLGISDVWMAPPYRALNAYNEEGYAVTDRYDLGEFPAGHNGATATKYGTAPELKTAIAALHAQGMHVQADIVPNQNYSYTDREVVPVTAVDQYGNPSNSKVVDKLYEVYTVGGGAGQAKYGTFPQWSSKYLNGISPQDLGIDRVLLDADGKPYRYFGPGNTGNYLPDWLARTDAAKTGEINAIDSYLTVDGYYVVQGAGTGNTVWRPLLLGYTEHQDGAIEEAYLPYMRSRGFGSADSTDDEVRAAITAASNDSVVNATNDYIGSQPGYSSKSEQGITALRFDDNDTSDTNKNLLQYEYLLGQDVDNSSPAVQKEQLNWENFLLDRYGFDGFRWDAAGHYNKEILEQAAALFKQKYGSDSLDHLNYIESYVPQQVDFENSEGNPQLAYDSQPYYAYLDALGKADSTEPLSDTITSSFVDRTSSDPGTAIPNWSFVNNHDQEHNVMASIPLTAAQANGQPYGTKDYQLAQYAIYTADRAKVDKTYAPYNVPAAYALELTNKDTVPTVYYGDMWEAADSYMSTKSPYYDAISTLLKVRKSNVSGAQSVQQFASNLSSTPGQDLIASVRAGTSRTTGIGIVVGDKADLDTTIKVDMGKAHGHEEYVDALGYHSETLTTDADGVLTVPVQGSKTVQVNGYLGAWVPNVTSDRVAGADRFDTAVQVSKAAYPNGADTVVVASGTTFPDALSAGPAAAKLGAPVLLTRPDVLPTDVSDEIARLKPKRIVLVGGAQAVSDDVATSLNALAPTTRISGADRFATSRAIADYAFPKGATTAIVATGVDFPDALSAGAAIGTRGPVLLVNGSASSLDHDTAAELRKLDVGNTYVAGGTVAVSTGIAGDLAAISTTKRLAGADRFGTSVAIDDALAPSAGRAFIATGTTYYDALAGSSWAAATGSPLFVVRTDCVPQGTLDALGRSGATHTTVLGGPAALSDSVQSLQACTS